MPTRPTVPPESSVLLGEIFAKPATQWAAGADLPDLLARLLEPIMQLCAASAGALRILSDSGDGFQLHRQIGLPQSAGLAQQPPQRAGNSGSTDRSAPLRSAVKPVIAGPSEQGFDEPGLFGFEDRQVMTLALAHGGRTLGLYHLFFAVQPAVDAATRALLKALGELLGWALGNARLEGEKLRDALARQRQEMAAEVHDSVAQTLVFVQMRMPLLQQAVADSRSGDGLRYCDDVRQAINSAHASLRQLVGEFRVPIDPLGLKHALRSLVLGFTHRTPVALEFDDQAPGLCLSSTQEVQVYHIVQESLANIAKHSSAEQAWLCIRQVAGQVHVVVEDNGSAGVAAEALAASNHFGVDIMRERAARLGGQLSIGPRQGGGMRVHLTFPLAPDTAGVT